MSIALQSLVEKSSHNTPHVEDNHAYNQQNERPAERKNIDECTADAVLSMKDLREQSKALNVSVVKVIEQMRFSYALNFRIIRIENEQEHNAAMRELGTREAQLCIGALIFRYSNDAQDLQQRMYEQMQSSHAAIRRVVGTAGSGNEMNIRLVQESHSEGIIQGVIRPLPSRHPSAADYEQNLRVVSAQLVSIKEQRTDSDEPVKLKIKLGHSPHFTIEIAAKWSALLRQYPRQLDVRIDKGLLPFFDGLATKKETTKTANSAAPKYHRVGRSVANTVCTEETTADWVHKALTTLAPPVRIPINAGKPALSVASAKSHEISVVHANLQDIRVDTKPERKGFFRRMLEKADTELGGSMTPIGSMLQNGVRAIMDIADFQKEEKQRKKLVKA